VRFLADEGYDFAVVTAFLIRFPPDARSALGQTIVDVRPGEGQAVSGVRIPYRKNGTIVSDTGSMGKNGGPWFPRAILTPHCWNGDVDKRTPSH
jgi:hypothetical protein